MRKKSSDARVSTGTNVDDSDTASVFDEVASPVPSSAGSVSVHGEKAISKVVASAVAPSLPMTIDVPSASLSTVVSPPQTAAGRMSRKTLGVKRKADTALEGEAGTAMAMNKRKPKTKVALLEPVLERAVPAAPLVLPKAEAQTQTEKTSELDYPRQLQPSAYRADRTDDVTEDSADDDYIFTIRPIMGATFDVSLPSDSSVFDLKDAIFTKTGLVPEKQLLASLLLPASFADEETFLEDLLIPKRCALSLSLKVATGLQSTSNITYEEEDYFVYEVLLPASSLPGSPAASDSDASQTAEGSQDGGRDRNREGSAGQTRGGERTSIAFAGSIVCPSCPSNHAALPPLPLPIVESYLKSAVIDHANDDFVAGIPGRRVSIHLEGLESLRISIVPEDETPKRLLCVPERPATPAPTDDPPLAPALSSALSPAPAAAPSSPPAAGPVRCSHCGRRCRPALQFLCKCGLILCQDHRYYDKHTCHYDFKSHDRHVLDQANPKVTKPQLEKL